MAIWNRRNTVKPYLQDGVAPQKSVVGIESLPPSTYGGRIFIPDTYWPKGFLESHTISNFNWIFDINYIPKKPNGYVNKRN